MMTLDQQRQQETIQFWRESAQRDRETAQSLFQLKRHDWSLFIFHLALEKMFKALVVKKGTTPPPTHDLERLAELADLTLSDERRDWLNEITGYNIEARYPSEKNALHQKATHVYTRQWHKRCEQIFLWLEQHLTE